ncbi:MAG: DUF488 family protein, partial [Candidatus Scalindua sp.]
ELAPSSDLRKWFSHRPERWQEFRQRYYMQQNIRKEIMPVYFLIS